ncbi:unnamed protein product [Vicia faba]|uniref:Uncharacterized protein n=1 Tax=Vicia faba TaxID=3906 RepID=A0AAV1AGG1_VICFA|nr:unnamed protein product [Vicia faba]
MARQKYFWGLLQSGCVATTPTTLLFGYVFLLIPLHLYSGYIFHSSALSLSSYSYFVRVLNRSYIRRTVSPSTNYPRFFQTLTPKTITSTIVSSSPTKRKRKVGDSAPLEEEYKQWVKDAKALKLAQMNRKNRVDNFKSASELRPTKTDGVDLSVENPCFVCKLDVFDTDSGDHKVRVCREKITDHNQFEVVGNLGLYGNATRIDNYFHQIVFSFCCVQSSCFGSSVSILFPVERLCCSASHASCVP